MSIFADPLGPVWLLPAVVSPFIGSFLGVLVTRLPAGRPVATGRSACPSCRHPLGPLDLVPIASWLVARGRCRYCGGAIGVFYPAIELASLAIALWAATVADDAVALWASCLLGWCLLALALIDDRHGVLPDSLVLPLIPLGLAVTQLIEPDEVPAHLIGCACGFLGFAGVRWLYRRLRWRDGLGFGDVKLLAAAGAWVSWQGLPSVVLIAALVGLLTALIRRRGRPLALDDRLALGPGLAAGFWLVWLYGPLV